MKTYEDMIRKAVTIADNDSNAFVGVFVPLHAVVDFDWNREGTFTKVQGRYKSRSGGTAVFFTNYSGEIYTYIAGYQFTHIFITEFFTWEDREKLKARIRYAVAPSPEPAGLYDIYGIVTRTESWR